MRVLLLCCLFFLPDIAFAGPWPREKGAGFAALSATEASYGDLYLEFGMGRNWTAIAEGSANHDATGHISVLLSKAFSLGRTQIALDFGLAQRSNGAAQIIYDPTTYTYFYEGVWGLDLPPSELRLGLAIGRGFSSPIGSGWLTYDLSRYHIWQGLEVRQQSNLTLGVSPTPWAKTYMQLQEYKTSKKIERKLELVGGVQLTKGQHLLVGYSAPISNGNGNLRLILWQDF